MIQIKKFFFQSLFVDLTLIVEFIQMKGKKMELRDFATKQQENVNVKMDYVSMV